MYITINIHFNLKSIILVGTDIVKFRGNEMKCTYLLLITNYRKIIVCIVVKSLFDE